jgi:hypothetical protein
MNKPNPTNQIRIIKKSTCPKLSSRAKGELTYHIGHDVKSKSFYFRVTTNTGGGFFSKEWISLDDITSTINKQKTDNFKAIIFIPLYASRGSNNHGFLAAALRAENVLDSVADQPLSHTLGNVKAFNAAMAKLIKAKTDLHDDVAEAEAAKEAKRQEMIERVKAAATAKNKSSTDEPQSS